MTQWGNKWHSEVSLHLLKTNTADNNAFRAIRNSSAVAVKSRIAAKKDVWRHI